MYVGMYALPVYGRTYIHIYGISSRLQTKCNICMYMQTDATHMQTDATHMQTGATHAQTGATHTQTGATHTQTGATRTQTGATHAQTGARHTQTGALNMEKSTVYVSVCTSQVQWKILIKNTLQVNSALREQICVSVNVYGKF